MIERLSSRRAFERLRAEGVRRGRGPLRLVSRLDPLPQPDPSQPVMTTTTSARVGYAVPRSVGNAVTRNRIRRRLRAVVAELHAAHPEIPPPGEHLIRVTKPIDDWPHARLRHTMYELFAAGVTR